jgi:D-serine deaminase-like pyridoxal phosphate-dependent protein
MKPLLHDLPTPALLVDLDRLERNVAAMAERADRLGVALRPHVKTHKCVEIGRMQVAAGATGITVSTLYEAEVFATAGFDDITWAFPVIPSRVAQARRLAERIRLGLVVDSPEAVASLAAERFPFEVWIKVDCGYHRCGVDPTTDAAGDLARRIEAAGMRFAGLLSHSGNAYDHDTDQERAAIAEEERARITSVADGLRAESIETRGVSVGSTPAMTAARDLAGVTEARPGNYAYFDLTQESLGACSLDDIALSVLTTVVSSSTEHAVVDAGALAMSKDGGPSAGRAMGRLIEIAGAPVGSAAPELVGLSQEHGKLDRSLAVGTLVRVLPNHSCLTAACFDHCYAVRGDRVEGRWRVWNGR